MRRGDEQFEIVPIGITEVDADTADRATDLNVESVRVQVPLPHMELGEGTDAKRDMVEGLIT